MQVQGLRSRSAWVAGGCAIVFIFGLLTFKHSISSIPTLQNSNEQWSSSRTVPTRSGDITDHVFNRTLGFGKIYVINLPYRTDHRDAMSLSAALTDLDVEYVDGVTEVKEKAMPPTNPGFSMDQGGLGAWRAHMNVLQRMIEQNITSALILEDDADWDLRIKKQMQDFAKASQLLLQPIAGSQDQYLDPTIMEGVQHHEPRNFVIGEHATEQPTSSPYGDLHRWDMLWLGHCGSRFPYANDGYAPLGRAVIPNDDTVPQKHHIKMQFGNDDLVNEYPEHTRVVSRAAVNTCSLAYGVSLPGARRILYELSLNKFTGPTDLSLRSICEGSEGRKARVCLTVQPQLFQHHRARGSKAHYSDISNDHEGFNERAFTRNVRWSTRMNIPKLLDGETDYIDIFQDGEPTPEIGFR